MISAHSAASTDRVFKKMLLLKIIETFWKELNWKQQAGVADRQKTWLELEKCGEMMAELRHELEKLERWTFFRRIMGNLEKLGKDSIYCKNPGKILEVLENFQQQILIAVDKKLGINTSLPSSLDFWNPWMPSAGYMSWDMVDQFSTNDLSNSHFSGRYSLECTSLVREGHDVRESVRWTMEKFAGSSSLMSEMVKAVGDMIRAEGDMITDLLNHDRGCS